MQLCTFPMLVYQMVDANEMKLRWAESRLIMFLHAKLNCPFVKKYKNMGPSGKEPSQMVMGQVHFSVDEKMRFVRFITIFHKLLFNVWWQQKDCLMHVWIHNVSTSDCQLCFAIRS